MGGKIRVCDIEKYYGNKNNLTKAVNRISFQVQNLIFIGLRQKGKFYTANFVNFQTLLELTLEILYI